MKKTLKKAFTLAEVVVAVAIIGTLAALTIQTYFIDGPSQKSQYVAGYRKVFSELTYAAEQIKSTNGGTLAFKFVDTNGNTTSEDEILNEFGKYLKYSKTCAWGGDAGKCWHLANTWSYLNGTLINDDYIWTSRAILSDGTLMYFNTFRVDCTEDTGTAGTTCAEGALDVNGFKGPNKVGRDIFRFWIVKNGIKANGDDTWYANNCINPGDTGNGCGARILRLGKMDY